MEVVIDSEHSNSDISIINEDKEELQYLHRDKSVPVFLSKTF